jgi:hypothetical protein
MDGLDDQALIHGNKLTIGRTDYLRFLALHDRLEKRFSSARIKEWFEALEMLKPPGRLPAIRAMKGKLRGYQKNGYGWLWFLYQTVFRTLVRR